MLRRGLIPVWVAIIILASMYLMGQGWGPEPSGPPAPVDYSQIPPAHWDC